MRKVFTQSGLMLCLGLVLMLTSGCTRWPYAASYKPLIDADNERLVKAASIEHHWVDNAQEMQLQSSNLYRQGYVMVGYSSMFSSHLRMVAPSGAKSMGKKVGAARVYQFNDRYLYVATYWRQARSFELGAYYEDAPTSAHERLGQNFGVIVQQVVEGTPADNALLMPGDLLLALDDAVIPNAAWLDEALAELSGQEVTLTVWPMLEVSPIKMIITLGKPEAT